MNNSIQKITLEIKNKYKRDKNVLGVMLFGSAARGGFDKYSDVDIYVLLRGKRKFSRENFVKNGIRIDVILDSLKDVNFYLKRDRENIRRHTSHMLAFGKIIYQKGNYLTHIQLIAKKNLASKTKFTKEEVLMHKYSIDDFWGEVQRDLKKKDYFSFGLNSQLLLDNILELFLKMNGDFLRRPNEMNLATLKLDHNFFTLINSFYNKRDFNEKKTILSKLVKYILKKSGGSLPLKWVIR